MHQRNTGTNQNRPNNYSDHNIINSNEVGPTLIEVCNTGQQARKVTCQGNLDLVVNPTSMGAGGIPNNLPSNTHLRLRTVGQVADELMVFGHTSIVVGNPGPAHRIHMTEPPVVTPPARGRRQGSRNRRRVEEVSGLELVPSYQRPEIDDGV